VDQRQRLAAAVQLVVERYAVYLCLRHGSSSLGGGCPERPRRRTLPADRHIGSRSITSGPDADAHQQARQHNAHGRTKLAIEKSDTGAKRIPAVHGAAASATALREVASGLASTRTIGRSSVDWYGASLACTSDGDDAATPMLPSGTFMAAKCLR
jgi:hypothetical protein